MPSALLEVLVLLGLLGSAMIVAGVFFRYATALSALIYGYLFLLDSFYYNNHYYLLILLGLLLSCTEADRVWALKMKKSRKKKKSTRAYIPYWNYFVLQLQLCIVYFYGGLAKLNGDWMSGKVTSFITDQPFQLALLTWGGLFFDLAIGFFLLWRTTRLGAMFFVVVFNLSNHFIFGDIAAFPLLALFGLFVFMEGEFWGSDRLGEALEVSPKIKRRKSISVSMKYLFIVFFIFQIVFPLRHYIIPGHAEWTGQGHYFSWRMKSFHKEVKLDMFAYDRTTKETLYPINTGLDEYKVQRIGSMPHQVRHFAKYLKKKIDGIDGVDENIGVSADYQASLNAREMAPVILPAIDLTSEEFYLFRKNDWIQPLINTD